MHREMDGKHIYFFASDSGQALDVCLEMKIPGRIEKWDLETGEIAHISSEIIEDGYTRVNWSFPPHGSLTLVVNPHLEPLKKEPITVDKAEIQMEAIWEFACDSPNALPLDRWELKITTKGDWLHYDYRTQFHVRHVPESISLLLDDVESRGSFMEGMRFQIHVNDQEIPSGTTGYYVDPKWKTFEIGAHLLKPGENRIHIRFTNQSWAGEPKAMTIPPRLLGNFALVPDGDGYVISKPVGKIRSGASWADQGYPFYSGAAVYTQQVTLDEEFLSAGQIWLEATEVADMVEFIVNEERAGVRPWPPYRCEISPLLKPGQNTIALKITNSMKNFIEGDTKPSGLLGSVRLERSTDAFY